MTQLTDYPNFLNLIRERYSCRSYDPSREVGDDIVRAVIEAAQLAPSACNRQPWTFVVVRDEEKRHRLLAKSRPVFKDAPVLIAAVGNHGDVWCRPADGKDHVDVDVSIAVEHICLAATTLGLGTCWICNFDVPATREVLGLPEDHEPIALIPLGYPTEGSTVPQKVRKPLEEILRWENF